ncbi:hypothetical protein [Lactococcus fujiensis]|uniref:hypothetical protein n=1 Tax=Lactococcus fujiensis TaxID=610251 RepID=UPI000BDEE847|nr:hypothetical protein [Lactococcus fujiensis]
MNFTELTHLSNEINKSRNWSPHRKVMFGQGILSSLHLPQIINQPSQEAHDSQNHNEPYSLNLISGIIDKLVDHENIHLMKTVVSQTDFSNHQKLLNNAFQHYKQPDIPEVNGIFKVFHKNCWLEQLKNKQKNIVLVVTGELQGDFYFFTEMKNKVKLNRLKFEQPGLYNFDFLKKQDHFLLPPYIKKQTL